MTLTYELLGPPSPPRTRWTSACDPAKLGLMAPPPSTYDEPPSPPRAQHCGGVLLFEEADLRPLAAPTVTPCSRLLRELLAAPSAAQREALVRLRLFEMGFDWMGYLVSASASCSRDARAFLVTYSPAGWAEQYFDAGYDVVDPRLARLTASSLPMAWDLEAVDDWLARRPGSALARRFARELRASGMGSGVLLDIPTREGAALLSLESSAASRRWIDDRVLGEAVHFAMSLHHHLTQHMRLPAPRPAARDSPIDRAVDRLPATQQAVLNCLQDGLTDRAIAQRLQLSPHTVDYHLRQLRQHFAVHNRVQLAAAAKRWLSPTA